MSTINASSLFHFTKGGIEALESILTNGFRLSYCMESYSRQSIVGIPMICFCDIPLMRTIKHRKEYGDYAIGVSKDAFRLKHFIDLNPVLYRNSIMMEKVTEYAIERMSYYTDEFKKMQGSIVEDNFDKISKGEKVLPFGNDEQQDILMSTYFQRHLYQSQIAYTKPYKEETNCYYDESEWRIVGDDMGETKWIWNVDKDNKEDIRGKENDRLWKKTDIYYGINSLSDISYIIVHTEKQVQLLVSFVRKINKLMGLDITSEEKDLLLTKITSFERMEKDY